MLKKIAFSFTVFFIALILVDFFVRHPAFALKLFNAPIGFYTERNPLYIKSNRHVADVDVKCHVAGDLAWMNGTGKKTREIHYVTDSHGYRNNFKSEKFDNILLGDSFALASITDQDDILVNLLNTQGASTYNISTDGANIWNEVIELKHNLVHNANTKRARHLIWCLFEGNDMEGSFFSYELDEVKHSSGKSLAVRLESYYKRSPLKRIFNSIFGGKSKYQSFIQIRDLEGTPIYFYEPYHQAANLDAPNLKQHPNYELVKIAFQEMARLTSAKGLSVTVLYVPAKERVYGWCYEKKARLVDFGY